ncbi:hypothetical protein [Kitasatospora sp. NPDC090091]|uniref:hypothetical protein n=1 Tax=Kitasatospora sp. NPDC090091 TaxID=3364081 RepID=UPI0037F370CF
MYSKVLQVVGGFLALVGLVVAGFGVRDTRRYFAPERPGTWRWLLGLVPRGFRWVTGASRRGPAGPREAVYAFAGPVEAAATAEDGRGRRMVGPLTVEQRLEEAVARVERCEGELGRLRRAVSEETRVRVDAVESLGVEAYRRMDKVDRDIDKITVDGLAGETWGLWLAGVGTALQIWGTLIAD